MPTSQTIKLIEWVDDSLRIVDQSSLRERVHYLNIYSLKELLHAIRADRLRGRATIEIAIAFGLYLEMSEFDENRSADDFMAYLERTAHSLAVSLSDRGSFSAVLGRFVHRADRIRHASSIAGIKQSLLNEANHGYSDHMIRCWRIGEIGFDLIRNKRSLLTLGDTGSLGSARFGIPLAPVYQAAEQKIVLPVFIYETCQTVQATRLMAFELARAGIPCTIVSEGAVAAVLSQHRADAVIISADRIDSKGNCAVALGGHGLALMARALGTPVYVMARASAIETSCQLAEEYWVDHINVANSPARSKDVPSSARVSIFAPRFDIIPEGIVDAIVTDEGILNYPFAEELQRLGATRP